MKPDQRLKVGSLIVFVASIGLGAASLAFALQRPDVSTTLGRLLCAGALANLSLAVLMALITLFALLRGEKWAVWALCLPIVLYGLPILALDAIHVEREQLLSTLAPQVLGSGLALTGLLLAGMSIFGASAKEAQRAQRKR